MADAFSPAAPGAAAARSRHGRRGALPASTLRLVRPAGMRLQADTEGVFRIMEIKAGSQAAAARDAGTLDVGYCVEAIDGVSLRGLAQDRVSRVNVTTPRKVQPSVAR